eukprot:493025-Amphidinium_carterae.1
MYQAITEIVLSTLRGKKGYFDRVSTSTNSHTKGESQYSTNNVSTLVLHLQAVWLASSLEYCCCVVLVQVELVALFASQTCRLTLTMEMMTKRRAAARRKESSWLSLSVAKPPTP